jgi:hypothetical protein
MMEEICEKAKSLRLKTIAEQLPQIMAFPAGVKRVVT